MQDVAKSDVDMVAEIQLSYVLESLKPLIEKLYRRNPRELLKGRFSDREAAVANANTLAQLKELDARLDRNVLRVTTFLLV